MKKLLWLFPAIAVVFATSCQSPSQGNASDPSAMKTNTPPAKVERIISVGPSSTEILLGLGLGNKIVTTDNFSIVQDGLNQDIQSFDMINPDTKQLLSMRPDLVIVTSDMNTDNRSAYKPLEEAGVYVAYIPSPSSISEIEKNIQLIGKLTKTDVLAKTITDKMETELQKYRDVAKTITQKKKVYFEVSADPTTQSFGNGVYLDEILDTIGAVNVFKNQKGWISVSEDSVAKANPDVILTDVSTLDDPVDEIKNRSGWSAIHAVANNQVFKLDSNAASLPDQNILEAIQQMASLIYPDKFSQ